MDAIARALALFLQWHTSQTILRRVQQEFGLSRRGAVRVLAQAKRHLYGSKSAQEHREQQALLLDSLHALVQARK